MYAKVYVSIVSIQFKNNRYILSRKSVGIDDVVSFPENRVVANEFVVDIEECLRTFRPSS